MSMNKTMLALAVLAALACTGQAFLLDLLPQLHPQLPQAQWPAAQPQYAQQYAQHYSPQYQYRRAVYEPQPQVHQYSGYSNSRPVLYQWLPSSRPTAYDAGNAHAYGNSNPITTFLQNPWFPWTSRQPLQQQQQVQQLQSSQVVSAQPQQVQQVQPPQQALWGFLPWTNNQQQAGAPGSGNPVLSWLQHPTGLWPWGQQSQQQVQGVRPIYTTPLAPSPAVSTLHVVSETPNASQLSAESSVHVKPEGVVLEDNVMHLAPGSNAIRRVSLDSQGQPCV